MLRQNDSCRRDIEARKKSKSKEKKNILKFPAENADI